MHSAFPGEQTPVHAPATHAEFEQGGETSQVPRLLQLWTLLPVHSTVPGAQIPVHAPAEHAFVHVELLTHCPADEQV